MEGGRGEERTTRGVERVRDWVDVFRGNNPLTNAVLESSKCVWDKAFCVLYGGDSLGQTPVTPIGTSGDIR